MSKNKLNNELDDELSGVSPVKCILLIFLDFVLLPFVVALPFLLVIFFDGVFFYVLSTLISFIVLIYWGKWSDRWLKKGREHRG